jgi:hypothetical protein
MGKIIKLTESQLELVINQILNENKKSDVLTESKEMIKKFQQVKKQKLKEGFTRKEINEGFMDWVKSLYSSEDGQNSTEETKEDGEEGFGVKTFVDTGKQWIIGWILEQMGVKGELNRIMKIALSNIEPSDYPKLFDPVDNCKWLSDVMFEGLLEYIVQKLTESFIDRKESSGSLFSSAISKSFKNLTDNIEFKTDMKRYLSSAICNALGGQSGEFELASELGHSGFDPKIVKGIKKKL